MSETKPIEGIINDQIYLYTNGRLIPKPITNKLLWEISELIVSRINIAMDNKLDKHGIDVLEGDWFDYLEETLTIYINE